MRNRFPATALISVDEYLARERTSQFKHEYIAGEVFAMSPQSKRHSVITDNIKDRLKAPLLARGCRQYSDVVVRVNADRFYYPDVVLECASADDEWVVRAPCFVVEVTSPSTRATDFREKAVAYRSVQTIRGYLVVEQKRRRVILYSHASSGEWSKVEVSGTGSVRVPCAETDLSLDDIYEGLDLSPIAVREDEDEYTVEDYEQEWVLRPAGF